MPILTGTIDDVTGSPIADVPSVRVTVRAPSRRASLAEQARLVASVPVPVEVSPTGEISVELEPGPAVMLVEGEGLRDVYELYVTADMTLLTEALQEMSPTRSWVESQMVQLRSQTVTAAADALEAAIAAGQDRAEIELLRQNLIDAANENAAPHLTQAALSATYADKATQTTVSTGRLSTASLDSAYAPRARSVLSSLIPTDGTGRPLWSLPVSRTSPSDYPPGVSPAWYGPGTRQTTTSPLSLQPVVAGMTYRVSLWARANRAGSVLYIDCVNQDGGPAVVSGGIGIVTSSRYLVHGLTLPTVWTRYEAELRFGADTTAVSLTDFFWNHSSGSRTDAVQMLAGLRLEPVFVSGGAPLEPAAWSGTQAQFDALGAKNPNRSYYIMEPTKAMYRGDTPMWRA